MCISDTSLNPCGQMFNSVDKQQIEREGNQIIFVVGNKNMMVIKGKSVSWKEQFIRHKTHQELFAQLLPNILTKCSRPDHTLLWKLLYFTAKIPFYIYKFKILSGKIGIHCCLYFCLWLAIFVLKLFILSNSDQVPRVKIR